MDRGGRLVIWQCQEAAWTAKQRMERRPGTGTATASRGQERGGERVLCDSRTRSDKGPLLKAVHKEALVAEQGCVSGSQLKVACSRASSSKTCAGLRSIPQRLQNPSCLLYPAALAATSTLGRDTMSPLVCHSTGVNHGRLTLLSM